MTRSDLMAGLKIGAWRYSLKYTCYVLFSVINVSFINDWIYVASETIGLRANYHAVASNFSSGIGKECGHFS